MLILNRRYGLSHHLPIEVIKQNAINKKKCRDTKLSYYSLIHEYVYSNYYHYVSNKNVKNIYHETNDSIVKNVNLFNMSIMILSIIYYLFFDWYWLLVIKSFLDLWNNFKYLFLILNIDTFCIKILCIEISICVTWRLIRSYLERTGFH